MYKILQKRSITPKANYVKIHAPEIALKAQPGQIVMIQINNETPAFPLSLADYNKSEGWIVVVCQIVGEKTKLLCSLEENETILEIKGPLLKPLSLKKIGTQVLIGGGSGIAAIYDMARGLKAYGNNVIVISGAKSAEFVFFEMEILTVSDEYYVVTSDGSIGEKGRVTDILQKLIDNKRKIDKCIVVGPPSMMASIKKITQENNINCQTYEQTVK